MVLKETLREVDIQMNNVNLLYILYLIIIYFQYKNELATLRSRVSSLEAENATLQRQLQVCKYLMLDTSTGIITFRQKFMGLILYLIMLLFCN